MSIVFDLLHVAHLNFFKAAIEHLSRRHTVRVVIRDRGNLVKIARAELSLPFTVSGQHRQGAYKILGLAERVLSLVDFCKRSRAALLVSCGFYSAIAARICGIHSVNFYDDLEYKLNFWPSYLFSHCFVLPKLLDVSGRNIVQYDGYKELAYLREFRPSTEVLGEYGLDAEGYVFVRHIAPISLNYVRRAAEMERAVQYASRLGMPILASIEPGTTLVGCDQTYRKLVEPCSDFHSLVYYSKLAISTGDTVAREASLLGVPTIYLGGRNMKINQDLIRAGAMVIPRPDTLLQEIGHCLARTGERIAPEYSQWDDTTEVIVNTVESYLSSLGQ